MEPLKPAAREQHPAAREQHPAAREPLVAARDLALSYDGRPALAGVSLELHAGEILAVVGANGCGKSSLLRVLARLDGGGRSSGTVAYRAQAAPLAAIRAFVPQRPEVAADFTAREVVRLGRYSVGADESAVARALEAVGLAARADLAFHELSGGERQRVAIARALAQLDQPAGRAGVLILDEPFAGIDPGEVARIARALLQAADVHLQFRARDRDLCAGDAVGAHARHRCSGGGAHRTAARRGLRSRHARCRWMDRAGASRAFRVGDYRVGDFRAPTRPAPR